MEQNDVEVRKDQTRRNSATIKKYQSNENIGRNGSRTDSRSYKKDNMSTRSARDSDKDDHNFTPKHWARKTYFVNSSQNI